MGKIYNDAADLANWVWKTPVARATVENTALALATMEPGVGESMDAAVLADRESTWWQRGLCEFSLAASVYSGGLTPNVGAFMRGEKRILANEGKIELTTVDSALVKTDVAAVQATTGDRGGPYGHLEDHPSVNSGKDFTQTQKKNILAENTARNSGEIRDDRTGELLVPSQQSLKGVTPPSNEAHVDHVYPASEGGPNSYANAEVRSRANNIEKSNRIEE